MYSILSSRCTTLFQRKRSEKMVVMLWIAPAIGAGMGIISGIASNVSRRKSEKRQHEREKELREQDKKDQYEMWQKTNHPEQVRQMKKAGLNPALVYGMGGGQGATTGNVGGGAGGGEGTQYDIAGSVANLGLMKAQKENIEANTEKTKAEAEKTRGVDTKLAESTQRSVEIETQVKEAIGVDYLERQARIEMQRKNGENAKAIREIDAWMEEAFDKESMEVKADAYGSYTSSEKDMIRKVQRAGLAQTLKKLESLKADIQLKDDEHILNEIEIEIREFREDLTKLGLNEVTSSILMKVIQMVFGRRRR